MVFLETFLCIYYLYKFFNYNETLASSIGVVFSTSCTVNGDPPPLAPCLGACSIAPQISACTDAAANAGPLFTITSYGKGSLIRPPYAIPCCQRSYPWRDTDGDDHMPF